MLFVDGENMTIRGQEFAKMCGVDLPSGDWYQPDRFLWLPVGRMRATSILTPHLREHGLLLQEQAIRAFFYTSVYGDDNTLLDTREALWRLGFNVEVFKKGRKGEKAKGVDIALTKDMLSNAFLNNYDVAVVITGDADYRPVIDEVKRLGKTVCLMAF